MTTLHYGKAVAWEYPPEFRELFRGFLGRFRTRGKPEAKLRVGLGDVDFYEARETECLFQKIPDELTFIWALSYWLRGLFAPRAENMLVLHASAVATERGAVVMAGKKGAGKSTLVRHLTQKGFAYLAEDAVGIKTGTWLAEPSLPMSFLPGRVAEETPLYRLLELHYSPQDPPGVKKLPVPEACLVLLRENYNLATLGEKGLEAISDMAEMGVWRVRFHNKHEAQRLIQRMICP